MSKPGGWIRLVVLLALAAMLVAACGGGSDDGADGAATTEAAAPVEETNDAAADTGAAADTAAEADEGLDGSDAHIAFFGLAAENAYTQYAYDAAKAEAEKLGGTIEFFDGKFDGATQYKQVQDATTSGRFNVFIIMPNDQAGIVQVVKQAIDKGILVGAHQFPVGTDPTDSKPQVEGLTTSIIEDVVKGAEITADGIVTACEGIDPCKVGIIWGARTVTWEAAKEKPLFGVLDQHPNIQVVGQADGGFLQAPGQKAAADFLQAHPDLNVIATPSGDQMIRGAEQALQRAGKTFGLGADDIKLVGYGASAYGVKQVADGKWVQTYSLVPQTMARDLVDWMVQALNGQTVPDGEVQFNVNPIGPVVTQETLAEHPEFEAEWDG